MPWRKFPILPLALAVMAGMGVHRLLPGFGLRPEGMAGCLLLAWSALCVWQCRGVRWWWRGFFFFTLLIWFAVFGWWRAEQEAFGSNPPRLSPELRGRAGVITRAGAPAGWRSVDVGLVDTSSGRMARVQVFLQDAPPVHIGDTLVFRTRLSDLQPPLNPGQFDYAGYMRRRGVLQQAFASSGSYHLVPRTVATHGPTAWRSLALARLRQQVTGADAFGVAAALTLGYRAELGDEVEAAYRDAGAMHILAVSGLHVGLVYLMAGLLLRPLLAWRPWGVRLAVLLRLALIWVFVLMAGAPLSARRAGLMFSLFSLGQTVGRRNEPLNALGLAALLLLSLRPGDLAAPGFQLSFLAVAGIIVFQPVLEACWAPPHRAARYLWQLLTVSLAAQAGTLPLILYHFHQFPVFFWLASLVAVPAAGLILGMGWLAIALAGVSGLGPWIGKALTGLIRALNRLTEGIARLPGATLTGVWLDGLELALLLLVLLAMALACLTRRARWWAVALFVGWLFLLLRFYGLWSARQQAAVVFYAADKVMVDVLQGTVGHVLYEPGLEADEVARIAGAYRAMRHIKQLRPIGQGRAMTRAGLLTAGKLRVGWQPIREGTLDVLLVLPKTVFRPDLLRTHPPDRIVWAASPYGRRFREYRGLAQKLGIPFHNLREEGALVLDFHNRLQPWR